jgi:hypothetical protein
VDIVTAMAQVTEAFPGHVFLPELPARGVGTDMIGRSLGLIDGIGFELLTTGWATADHPSRAQRRARACLRDDLDLAAASLSGYTGSCHLSVTGPWTLAAVVSRAGGEALVCDPGACRDLAQAWAEAVAQWCTRAAGLLD